MLNGGLFAGMLGYGTVVMIFVVFNAVGGRSAFYTPAMLGSALFYGLNDPAALQITPGPILAYNMVHLVAYLLFGMMGSWLVSKAERYPAARFAALFVGLFVAGHVYAALILFAAPLLGTGAWWQIGLASALSAVVMGGMLLRLHPLLRAELKRIPLGDEAESEA
jgi:hypothetical protein